MNLIDIFLKWASDLVRKSDDELSDGNHKDSSGFLFSAKIEREYDGTSELPPRYFERHF